MAFERLVGLQVIDEAGYQAYRDAMTPLLVACGGGFGYDFKIAEVLKSATPEPINRVFTLHFPDQATMETFFADPRYQEIRRQHFDRSVAAVTRIAAYERE